MPHANRPHHVLVLLSVASIAALSVLVVAPEIATAHGDDEAVCFKPEAPPEERPSIETPPPLLKALVFNGDVTIGGNAPGRQGYMITANIGRYWESTAVPVGVGRGCGSMRYAHLIVAPPEELDLFGSQIDFWLNGQVRSEVYDWYHHIDFRDPVGYPAVVQWTFPTLRQVDLEFPAVPDGYRPQGSLPPTGGASPGEPMLVAFLILGLLATIGGLVGARQWRRKSTCSTASDAGLGARDDGTLGLIERLGVGRGSRRGNRGPLLSD